MIILLKNNADEKQVGNLKNWLISMGFDIHLSVGQSQTIMGLIGDTSRLDIDVIKSLEIVENVQAESPNIITACIATERMRAHTRSRSLFLSQRMDIAILWL